MKKSVIENICTPRKLELFEIEHALDGLHFAFIDENDELDDRFYPLWDLFLRISGWTEEEFWQAHNDSECEECSECKAKRESELN